jgi:hypothetical protein
MPAVKDLIKQHEQGKAQNAQSSLAVDTTTDEALAQASATRQEREQQAAMLMQFNRDQQLAKALQECTSDAQMDAVLARFTTM